MWFKPMSNATLLDGTTDDGTTLGGTTDDGTTLGGTVDEDEGDDD
jgi:hypothetical protein